MDLSGMSKGQESKWHAPNSVRSLATTLIELYEQTKQKFSVDDHRHYLFNPRYGLFLACTRSGIVI